MLWCYDITLENILKYTLINYDTYMYHYTQAISE